MSKTPSRATLKWRLFLLRALSLVCCVGPLATVLVANWDQYVKKPSDAIKLGAGGVVIVILIVLALLRKIGIPGRLVVLATLTGILWLIQPIINDLLVIMTATTVCEAVDILIFSRMIKRTEESLRISRAADQLSARLEEQADNIMKNYTGRV
jgi:hypothetical protein